MAFILRIAFYFFSPSGENYDYRLRKTRHWNFTVHNYMHLDLHLFRYEITSVCSLSICIHIHAIYNSYSHPRVFHVFRYDRANFPVMTPLPVRPAIWGKYSAPYQIT